MITERHRKASSLSEGDALTGVPDENQPAVKTNRDGIPSHSARSVAGPSSTLESTEPTFPKRQKLFGSKPLQPAYTPAYREFRKICDRLVEEIWKLEDFLEGDKFLPEVAEVTVEIEALLEQLFDCEWGQGEGLKSVVVAIQSQINNTVWDKRHFAFLTDVIPFLRVRYLVDRETVNQIYDAVRNHGLDEFRGTVSETPVKKKYRLEEVV
jgi:hypothetical protein